MAENYGSILEVWCSRGQSRCTPDVVQALAVTDFKDDKRG